MSRKLRLYFDNYKFGDWFGVGILVATGLFWVVMTFWQNTFAYDQALYATTVRNITQGTFPSYGPPAAISNFSVPSNYYWVLAVIGFWTSSPLPLAIFNTVCLILSLYLSWRILQRLTATSPYSTWLSNLGILALSVNWAWFLLAVKTWNPNSLVLASLILILWLERIVKASLDNKTLGIKELVGFGFLFGNWITFHSSSLIVLPFFITLSLLIYLKKASYRILAWIWLGGLVAWIPYWISEFTQGWQNSKNFIIYLVSTGGDLKRLGIFGWLLKRTLGFFTRYIEVVNDIYFVNLVFWLAGILAIFSIIGLYFGEKKTKLLRNLTLGLVVVFLLAASNLSRDFNYHYKVLVLVVPILGSIAYIAIPTKNFWIKISQIISAVIIFSSIAVNTYKTSQLVVDRLDSNVRDLNTTDYENILNFAKSRGLKKICTFEPKKIYQSHFDALRYYDKYVTKTEIVIQNNCPPEETENGTLILIEPSKIPNNLQEYKQIKTWQENNFGVYLIWV